MKNQIYIASVLVALGLSFNACKKDKNQHLNLKDGIIGCLFKSNGVVAAIDPVTAPEFSHSPLVSDGIAVGPSTISSDNALYYTVAADLKLHEIGTSDGKVRRSIQLQTPYSFLVYDETGKRLLGLSSNNDLIEINLKAWKENTLGSVAISEGVLIGTEFMRNGKLCFMGKDVLMSIDPSNLTVSKIYAFDMQLNSVGYDAAKDKLYYIATPAGTKGISLFEYDFAGNKGKMLKNYPDISSFIMHSTAYNPFTGQYHFYSSNTERTSIDVNTLQYKIEKVDYALVNTEVFRGCIKLPDSDIEG